MLPKKEAAEGKKKSAGKLTLVMRGSRARCVLAYLCAAVIMYLLFCIACMSSRYTLKAGDISHQTINATKTVEDVIATEQARKAAAQSVEASYHLLDGANEEVLNRLDSLFAQLSLIQQYGQNLRFTEESRILSSIRSFSDEEVRYAQTLVTDIKLTGYQTRVLLRTETDNFNNMVSKVRAAVENALSTTIREGQVQKSINSINALCQYEVDKELMDYIVPPLLNACVKANMVVDEEATDRAREEARAAVQPITYQQGQNIVREGERVTESQLAILESLGLLSTANFDFSIFGGAAMLLALTLAALALLLYLLRRDVFTDLRSMLVIMLVMIICEGLSVICVKLISIYLVPVALCAMLLTTLLGARAGLTAGLCMTLLNAGLAAASSSAYAHEMVALLTTGFVSSVVAVQFLNGKPQRMRMVICGVLVAVMNALTMLSLGLMTSADLHETMGHAVWSMAGGILSGLIAVGFQPVFETAFNLATPSKLLELANPNQPLLRRLQMEAPGTYHHSIVVANLAEAAAEKIGANPLLARTGAYFHDIGKLKRPMYFKENQRGENPHDRTSAYVSASIVTAHTSDGLALAQKHHLPPEIQRIIVEHHGDTPVMYFYHKALQQADGKPVDIKDFRYGGSRPTTRESAVVMLADTIEAAVRSMPEHTPQAIKKFIERLVRGKLEDGQLSGSPLTLHDIDGICEAFSKVLSGVFHERIEYPTVTIPAGGQPAAAKPASAAKSAADDAKPAASARLAAEDMSNDTMPAPYNAPMPDGMPEESSRQTNEGKPEDETT